VLALTSLLLAVPEALLRDSQQTELACKEEEKQKEPWCCAENDGKAQELVVDWCMLLSLFPPSCALS